MLFQLNDIAFAYTHRPVFRGLSLAIESPGFYGLIGPNGCGKTTLLDLLCGLRRPSSGAVRFRGQDLTHLKRRQVARSIALVPQEYAVNFPFSVQQVVMMGRYPHMPRFAGPAAEDKKMVDKVLDLTGLTEFRKRPMTSLSGGERQRVVFARALAQDAEVLVLDEATANMDIRHSLNLLELARRQVRQGRTTLGVFQDLNLAAAYCDRLIALQDGQIAAMGSTREILTAGLLQKIFEVDAKVFDESYIQAPQVVVRPLQSQGRI
jgi:iron complex transport system ATP-binding protein